MTGDVDGKRGFVILTSMIKEGTGKYCGGQEDRF